MITAATILRLVDQGLLGLDDLLADHVDFEVATPITIRHLLQHTSVIPDDCSIYESCDPDEVLAGLAALAADPSNPDPGSTSEYSTTGFNLLSLVMSSATGLDAAEVLRQEVFDPLSMTSSFFTGAEDGPPLVVGEDGWRRDCPVDEEMDIWTGGGYASSAEELDTFLRALFEGDLLSAASLTQMTTVGSNVFGFDYGLGLAVFNLPVSPDEASYGHWGEVPGWQAGGLYDPGAERTVVVLVEGDQFQRTAMAAAAWASGSPVENGTTS
jgi:D-alanyl-D-alanine carboxypeptidase